MCCPNIFKCITKKTIYYTFLAINAIILTASTLIIIYNVVVTLSGVLQLNAVYNIQTIPGVSSYAAQTVLVLSTLLVTLFSGIAALGVESAAYRDYWSKKPFITCCCIHILKLKMGVYIMVVGGLGVLIFLIAVFLQTGVIDLNLTDVLTNVTIGSCNNLFENEIVSFQQNNNCCGIVFVENSNSGVPTCANWDRNYPQNCGCDNSVGGDLNCMSKATASDLYGCKFDLTNGGDQNGIWDTGCLEVMNDAYFQEFGLFWILCYVLGASFLVMSILGICICYQDPPEKNFETEQQWEENIISEVENDSAGDKSV